MKIKKCVRCETVNQATGKFCCKCGMALEIQVAIELDEQNKKMNQLIEMPGVKEFLDQKLKEMQKPTVEAGAKHG